MSLSVMKIGHLCDSKTLGLQAGLPSYGRCDMRPSPAHSTAFFKLCDRPLIRDRDALKGLEGIGFFECPALELFLDLVSRVHHALSDKEGARLVHPKPHLHKLAARDPVAQRRHQELILVAWVGPAPGWLSRLRPLVLGREDSNLLASLCKLVAQTLDLSL